MNKLSSLLPKKNIKFIYYLKGIIREYVPRSYLRKLLNKYLYNISEFDRDIIQRRLNYYNRLFENTELNSDAPELRLNKYPTKDSAYHFDFIEFSRFFDQELKCNLFKGDITHVPSTPTIVKSRPIHENNRNSVLLNLNKVRHFVFIKDQIPFEQKKDLLIWRGSTGLDTLQHRKEFLKMHFNQPLCDIGNVNPPVEADQFTKDRITMNEHLKYKFILCIEGVDVATNLKWVMSSNSVAVMPKPKHETWFMEATLIPNYHYIEISDDYTDLDERLNYYIKHPCEANEIVRNANEFVRQFQNSKLEKLVSLAVLEKYFVQTGQMEQISVLNFK